MNYIMNHFFLLFNPEFFLPGDFSIKIPQMSIVFCRMSFFSQILFKLSPPFYVVFIAFF